ncbi:MAG: helix-turn-helix transcriptional regulator [Ruminococcaceae bacterium]|nr:helix-turn-helix transcriptional regulator [Oscillospiraceae bacterium]
MNIGKIIRTRRREKDMTQEVLAEMLGVSVSAVSLWESGKTMPDIALIPAICSVLELSADTLLEVDLEKKTAEIEKIREDASKYGRRGYTQDALTVIDEGLKKYPDSVKLLLDAMHYRYNLGETDTVIEIGEKLLEKGVSFPDRGSVIQILCYKYRDKNPQRAEQLLEETNSLYVSREMIAKNAYTGDKQLDAMQGIIPTALDMLLSGITMNVEKDSGERRYTREESALAQEKAIAIVHLIFDEGDFGFYHCRMERAEMSLAYYYADRRDAEKTLGHLRRAAHHAIEFVKFAAYGEDEYVNTSLVLRGYKSGGFSTTGSENQASMVRNGMAQKRYDFVRDTDAFREILASLDEYAGQWDKME